VTNKTRMMTKIEHIEERFGTKDLIFTFADPNREVKQFNTIIKMLIVPVKDGESLEKALKKFKKKVEKTGLVKELRERQKFTKPSVHFRMQKIKAVYVEKIKNTNE
jgi:small subunit ribosomal protein S21